MIYRLLSPCSNLHAAKLQQPLTRAAWHHAGVFLIYTSFFVVRGFLVARKRRYTQPAKTKTDFLIDAVYTLRLMQDCRSGSRVFEGAEF